MKLNQIRDNPGARKKGIVVGRGIGCGKGKTCGRGVKGQKARTGVSLNGFEGGQMPLYRRLPKRGFNNPSAVHFDVVNLADIQEAIDSKKLDAGKPIDAKTLAAAGIISGKADGLRLLGNGDLKSKATIVVCGASAAAVKAVEKAGGKVELVIKEVKPVVRKKKIGK